jgi:hypothetical protein
VALSAISVPPEASTADRIDAAKTGPATDERTRGRSSTTGIMRGIGGCHDGRACGSDHERRDQSGRGSATGV